MPYEIYLKSTVQYPCAVQMKSIPIFQFCPLEAQRACNGGLRGRIRGLGLRCSASATQPGASIGAAWVAGAHSKPFLRCRLIPDDFKGMLGKLLGT